VRAPVYRNIDGKNTFLGLAFPGEALGVLAAFWLLLATLPPKFALPVGVGLYLAIRLLGRGKPPKHLQSWLTWRLRRHLAKGRLCAVARAKAPRFPFADYERESTHVASPPVESPRAPSAGADRSNGAR
jgi:hypothetical protein